MVIYKKISLAMLILSSTGCSSTATPERLMQRYVYKESVTQNAPYKISSPQKNKPVAVYQTTELPTKPYRILGKAQVERTNLFGITRQPQTIEHSLKKLAASIGGDAIMNIHSESSHIKADVIGFEKLIF